MPLTCRDGFFLKRGSSFQKSTCLLVHRLSWDSVAAPSLCRASSGSAGCVARALQRGSEPGALTGGSAFL